MDTLWIIFIAVVITTINAMVVGAFHLQWHQEDDELPPLVKFYKKRIVISAIVMVSLTLPCGFLTMLWPQYQRLFGVITVFLSWLASVLVCGYVLRYISLRRELSKRKIQLQKKKM
jgi:hypothetical protein